MNLEQLLPILPMLSTIIYCLLIIISVSGFKYSKITSWIWICIYLLFLITVNALIFYKLGEEQMENFYILTVFLPTALFLKLLSPKKGISYVAAVFNAYLAFNLTFLIESTFKPFIAENLLWQASIYFICFPLVIIYSKLIYKNLHDIVEELLPKYLFLLLIYGVTLLAEIWFYRYIINSTDTNLLRLNIFSLAILSVYFISIVGFYIFLRQYRKKNIELQEKVVLDEKIVGIVNQYQIRQSKENELKILRHDMKHILINVSQLMTRGEIDEAQQFIKSYTNAIDATSTFKFCKDQIIDTVLEFYMNKCDTNDIKFHVKVNNFEDILDIPSHEIALLISNCLDNAINASLKLENKRSISFSFINNDNRLILQIKNNFDGEVQYSEDNLPTNNEENHGIGTKSIKLFAQKNNLMLDYKITKNTFKITILFPNKK